MMINRYRYEKRLIALFLAVLMICTLLPVSASAVSSYNASNAAAYALKWWDGFNTANWYNWESEGLGDCANLVSHAYTLGDCH